MGATLPFAVEESIMIARRIAAWVSARIRDRRLRESGVVVGTVAYTRAMRRQGVA